HTLHSIITKSFLAVFVIAIFAFTSSNFKHLKNKITCTSRITVNNSSGETITKVIADASPDDYDDYSDLATSTSQDLYVDTDNSFDFYVRFDYDPTVRNKIIVRDGGGNVIYCQDIISHQQ